MTDQAMDRVLEPSTQPIRGDDGRLELRDGSRVAVIGCGPAGSLFCFFLLDMAERLGLQLAVDVYEAKDFGRFGPAGCNHCGGIISESLVQLLATEGLNLPPMVVQRGIDSYVLHMDEGAVRIDTPVHEKRIAAVYRGAGPVGVKQSKWLSFDGYLQGLAMRKGARLIRDRVQKLERLPEGIRVSTKGGQSQGYDLVAIAAGINSATLKLVDHLDLRYSPPQTAKTYICEVALGQETVERQFGSSMHVFLLDLPRLDFAALIPKGDYVTLCLMGKDIDKTLVQSFLDAPEVRRCFPAGWSLPDHHCRCTPSINIRGAVQPFADRLVFIGDCGATRLYKDGIGAAYRTSKAAAMTAVYQGVSAADFKKHFWPTCRAIAWDNRIGAVVFGVTHLIQKLRAMRRGVLRMVEHEQSNGRGEQRMSTVLWDTFTGSAPYQDVFLRAMHPVFLAKLLWDTIVAGWWALINRS
jgi:flavin-dependent dehydrogenase